MYQHDNAILRTKLIQLNSSYTSEMDIKNREWRRLSVFACTCIATVVAMSIPLAFDWSPVKKCSQENIRMISALSSVNFKLALVSAVSMSSAMFFEVIITLVSCPRELLKSRNIINVSTILFITFPNLAIFWYVTESRDVSVTLYLMWLRVIIFSNLIPACICSMCPANRHIWMASVVCAASISTSRVLAFYSIFFGEDYGRSMYVIELVLHIIGVMALVGVAISQWFKRKSDGSTPCNRLILSLHLISLLIILVAITVLIFIYPSYKWELYDSRCLIAMVMLHTTDFVAVGVLHGQSLSREGQLLKDSMEIKQMFFRYLSHELRTPMNSFMMGLQLLKNELIQSQARKDHIDIVDQVHASGTVAVNLLDNMMLRDKIESKNLRLERDNVIVWEFVCSITQPFLLQAMHSGIGLQITARHSIRNVKKVDVFVDKTRLGQVIQNLLSNALKFTPRGGLVEVSVGTLRNRWKKDYVVLKVKDTGCGMEKDKMKGIFMGDISFLPGTLQAGSGAGLGLYISKGIVEAHGGSLSMHSDGPGEGCTVRVLLPLNITQKSSSVVFSNLLSRLHSLQCFRTRNGLFSRLRRVADCGRRSSSPPLDKALGRFEINSLQLQLQRQSHDDSAREIVPRGRLLIVDDSKMNRTMLRRLLAQRFSQIEEAEDGQQAVAIVQQKMKSGENFDVITMDYQMPVMDGPTATTLLRYLGYQGVIIAVTGNAIHSDRDTFINAGADGLLIKPLKLEEFDIIVNESQTYSNCHRGMEETPFIFAP